MAISETRLAANRANAKKSTGPRTAQGKARSRGNALKHGLSASVLGRREDGLRPVLGALHRPDPRDIEALLWPGATRADQILAAQVAAHLAQMRALQEKKTAWLGELEALLAAQQVMTRCEPETVIRLGWRIDHAGPLIRRHYFEWPIPKILGWPWQPTGKGRRNALAKLLLVQRYERALRRDRYRLLNTFECRREEALAASRSNGQAGAGDAAGDPLLSLPAWPEIPARPAWQPPEAEVQALLAVMALSRPRSVPRRKIRRRKVRPFGARKRLAVTKAYIREFDELLAKRTQASEAASAAAAVPASSASVHGPAGASDPEGQRGSLAQPRPPPDDEGRMVMIMPGQTQVAWRPGRGGFVPAGAGDPRDRAIPSGEIGPLAAGRLTHEPRPHGLGPFDWLVPLIPPQPILDERMNEVIVTLDPTQTRGRERDRPPEAPIGRWRRGPDGRFDRFLPGKGTYRDPWIPPMWWGL